LFLYCNDEKKYFIHYHFKFNFSFKDQDYIHILFKKINSLYNYQFKSFNLILSIPDEDWLEDYHNFK
jgi:hypothetical protein